MKEPVVSDDRLISHFGAQEVVKGFHLFHGDSASFKRLVLKPLLSGGMDEFFHHSQKLLVHHCAGSCSFKCSCKLLGRFPQNGHTNSLVRWVS